MGITEEELRIFEHQGFVLIPEYFARSEVAVMRAELASEFAVDSPRRVVEKDGKVVRSVYGSHRSNEVFRRLAHHRRLVEPAMQILGSQVYVYQFKINAKTAFTGDIWEWHQDYIFWLKEDGMPTERVVNALVFLDEVTEFNGPLFVVPGSHKEGVFNIPSREELPGKNAKLPEVYKNNPAWISNLTADLKYSLDKEIIADLIKRRGIAAPKGPEGSVLFFHCNLVHGSTNNISPFDRVNVIISFNSIDNIPVSDKEPRPDFLVSRDSTPIVPLPDDVLLH
jgi:ectoine hydroxylase-related dioxygenase (phytanoyl-CoA dioxygenase family)